MDEEECLHPGGGSVAVARGSGTKAFESRPAAGGQACRFFLLTMLLLCHVADDVLLEWCYRYRVATLPLVRTYGCTSVGVEGTRGGAAHVQHRVRRQG